MRFTTLRPKKPHPRRTWPVTVALGAVLLGIAVAVAASHPANRRTPQTPTTKPTIALHVTGQGDATPPAFTTGSDWALTYSYDCQPGNSTFRVVERGGLQNGVALADQAGTGSSATTYVHAAPGIHRLVIETGCTWTLTVLNGDTMPHAGGEA